jgi:hypothetical protein|tara:strand:- start:233 stop:415 length:183 start_codon:yes stop_codon:yes gene_type:complete
MNKTVRQSLLENIKKMNKALIKDTPKKRSKYKTYQKRINQLYKMMNLKGSEYLVQEGDLK